MDGRYLSSMVWFGLVWLMDEVNGLGDEVNVVVYGVRERDK